MRQSPHVDQSPQYSISFDYCLRGCSPDYFARIWLAHIFRLDAIILHVCLHADEQSEAQLCVSDNIGTGIIHYMWWLDFDVQ